MAITITIPQELTEIYDLNQPLYLYLSSYNYGDNYKIRLSKKKIKDTLCYGLVIPNENNSFNINDSTATKVAIDKYYIAYKTGASIYIKPVDSTYCKFIKKVKLHIPEEILKLSCVNFNKKVYLCYDGNRFYLTNHYSNQLKHKHIDCFGTVKLDVENDIELTPNMCSALRLTSLEKVLFCTDSFSIVISKC